MQDQYGLVPSAIKANYEREEMVDEQMAKAFSLYHALQAMDRRLDLVFIPDRADPEFGVKPGRWHVVRKNDPPAPDSYMAIETPDGKYMEPHSGILRDLADRDLWKHGTPENDRRPAAFTEPSKDDGFVDELAHDLRAGLRLPGDGGLEKKLWGRGKPKGLVGS
jgi:hypothetical protein